MKKIGTISKILSFAVALLMLLALGLQFLPFWTVEDNSVSVSDYLWFPKENKDLTNTFKDFYKAQYGNKVKYSANDVYLPPVVIFISCVLGIVLSCLKPGKWYSFLLPILGGSYGAYGFSINPLLQMGQNWSLHMTVCVIFAAVGALGFVLSILSKVKLQRKASAFA